MVNKKKILLSGVIIISSLIILMFIMLKFVQNPAKSILIVSEDSQYKNQLVKILSEEFEKKNITIKVMDVSFEGYLLDDIIVDNWSSIIILNTIRAGKLNWFIENFIVKNNFDNKIVLINTSDSGDTKTDHAIDAITTASEMNQVDTVKDMILARVN